MRMQMARKPREANFELLRILSMWMVVILHTLSGAEALVEIGVPLSAVRLTGNYLEALCIVAVNVYVLLSGWFLSAASFRWKRLGRLLAEVFFYVLLIPAVLLLFGQPVQIGDIWSFFNYILPVSTEHYWFITAYVMLFVFVPVLNAGIHALEQKAYRGMLLAVFFFFCILKSFCPVQLSTDHAGYDFGWFICLYLLAAYGRRYGFGSLLPEKLRCRIQEKAENKEQNREQNREQDKEQNKTQDKIHNKEQNKAQTKKRVGLFIYLISTFLIWLLSCVLWLVHDRTGALAYYAQVPFHYNALLTLTGALGLFIFFRHCTIPEGRAAAVIEKLSPYTLGVYLIHEHRDVRSLWFPQIQKLLGQVPENPLLLLIWVLAAAAIVYAVCTVIDWGRSRLVCLVRRCVSGIRRK